jgi:hypothetical protein
MSDMERERVIEHEPSSAYVEQMKTENLAAQSRPMQENETISGEVVADFRDKAGNEFHLVETDKGEMVAVPKEPEMYGLPSVGDDIEVTRNADNSYDVSLDNGYGR